MSWRGLPVCGRCWRAIHGPGTGMHGPWAGWRVTQSNTPDCHLCAQAATPLNVMRLWTEEPPSWTEIYESPEWQRDTPLEPMPAIKVKG